MSLKSRKSLFTIYLVNGCKLCTAVCKWLVCACMCLSLCYLSGKEQFCAVQVLLLLLYSLSSVSLVRARACMCGCRLHLSLSEYMRPCTMTNQPTVNWERERETDRQTEEEEVGGWGGGRCRHSSEPQTQTQSQFWTSQHFIWLSYKTRKLS